MSANLPPTLDGLLLKAEDSAKELIEDLEHLERYTDRRMVFADQESKEAMEQLSLRIWQAVGMAEGASHMLNLAKEMRHRCLT